MNDTPSSSLPAIENGGTGAAELRIITNVKGEKTEYTVHQVGSSDRSEGFNVFMAHDPNGDMILDHNADTQDEAIEQFVGRFGHDEVEVLGAKAFAVVRDGKVLAVEDSRDKAYQKSKDIAEEGGPESPTPTGSVHPATTAVKEMFEKVGTEGTRIMVNNGDLVTLAR